LKPEAQAVPHGAAQVEAAAARVSAFQARRPGAFQRAATADEDRTATGRLCRSAHFSPARARAWLDGAPLEPLEPPLPEREEESRDAQAALEGACPHAR
jgi:hypothetical protein